VHFSRDPYEEVANGSSSAPSGGTLATAIGLIEVHSLKELAASTKPFALSPVPNTHPTPKASIFSMLTGLYTFPNLGLLHTSITGSTNAAIVQRTWGLFKQEPSRQKEFYGPKFTFREFMKAQNFVTGIAAHYGLIIGGALLLLVPPVRALMRMLVFKPGEGPSKEASAKEYIEFRGTAKPDLEKSGKQAFVKAWYSGSMYYRKSACDTSLLWTPLLMICIVTATLLAQAAVSILENDLELEGGVYTPACLGQGYIDHLNDNGFKVEMSIVDA
jgi:short subunit dehydrogenase-like uncharacterized protein